MKYGSIVIEKKEFVYLKRIIDLSGYAEDIEIQRSLQRLSEELQHAHIVEEDEMPKDIVRLASTVTVLSEKGWQRSFQVVIPSERDPKNNKISILTPMGAALFGYSKDDTVIWDFPGGKQQLEIVAVSQVKNSEQMKTSN